MAAQSAMIALSARLLKSRRMLRLGLVQRFSHILLFVNLLRLGTIAL